MVCRLKPKQPKTRSNRNNPTDTMAYGIPRFLWDQAREVASCRLRCLGKVAVHCACWCDAWQRFADLLVCLCAAQEIYPILFHHVYLLEATCGLALEGNGVYKLDARLLPMERKGV